MKQIIILILAITLGSCKSNTTSVNNSQEADVSEIQNKQTNVSNQEVKEQESEKQLPFEKVVKTNDEWKNILTEQEYYVLREEGTERPFTSDLLKEKREGMFVCGACELDLFDSSTKFKSGTGWPSFFAPVNEFNVQENTDYKIGYARTEVECARCGGHLGHVFNDGPEPTGHRYCINGVALNFRLAK